MISDASTWCPHPVCERCLSQYEKAAHDAARAEYELKLEAVREMAAAKRLQFWRSHEQASSDYWRNMFGLMAEAWGEVARGLEEGSQPEGDG
jgi:hypothetical protein